MFQRDGIRRKRDERVRQKLAAGRDPRGSLLRAAVAADLSTVGQWTNKYPFDKIAGGKSLWDQPGVQATMRVAMGKRFFALSLKEMHGPEGPVAGGGKGFFAAWSCKAHDCGGNQMTVFFDSALGQRAGLLAQHQQWRRGAGSLACQWQDAPASCHQRLRLCRGRSFRGPEEIRRRGVTASRFSVASRRCAVTCQL